MTITLVRMMIARLQPVAVIHPITFLAMTIMPAPQMAVILLLAALTLPFLAMTSMLARWTTAIPLPVALTLPFLAMMAMPAPLTTATLLLAAHI